MKYIKVFEQFLKEAKYTKLNSVGTIIDQDGVTYPMYNDGTPDLDGAVELSDIDKDDDWYKSLDSKDKRVVDAMMKKLGLNEGTWALNKSKIKAFIKDLDNAKSSKDISKLKDSYYHHIGDDMLWDSLDRAEEADNRDEFNNNVADAIGRLEDLNESKNINAIIDILSNSMEHYDEDTFMNASNELGYDSETMKEIFNDYWSINPIKREDFTTSDWKKWLKSYK